MRKPLVYDVAKREPLVYDLQDKISSPTQTIISQKKGSLKQTPSPLGISDYLRGGVEPVGSLESNVEPVKKLIEKAVAPLGKSNTDDARIIRSAIEEALPSVLKPRFSQGYTQTRKGSGEIANIAGHSITPEEVGSFLGATIPVGASYYLLGNISWLEDLATYKSFSPSIRKKLIDYGVRTAGRGMRGGAAGVLFSLYEGEKDPSKVATNAAAFAVFDGAIGSIGDLISVGGQGISRFANELESLNPPEWNGTIGVKEKFYSGLRGHGFSEPEAKEVVSSMTEDEMAKSVFPRRYTDEMETEFIALRNKRIEIFKKPKDKWTAEDNAFIKQSMEKINELEFNRDMDMLFEKPIEATRLRDRREAGGAVTFNREIKSKPAPKMETNDLKSLWNDVLTNRKITKKPGLVKKIYDSFVDTFPFYGRLNRLKNLKVGDKNVYTKAEAEKLVANVSGPYDKFLKDMSDAYRESTSSYDKVLSSLNDIQDVNGTPVAMDAPMVQSLGETLAVARNFISRIENWPNEISKLPNESDLLSIKNARDEIISKVTRGDWPANILDVANEIDAGFKKYGLIAEDTGQTPKGTVESHPDYLPHDTLGYNFRIMDHLNKKALGSIKEINTNIFDLMQKYSFNVLANKARIDFEVSVCDVANKPEMKGIEGFVIRRVMPQLNQTIHDRIFLETINSFSRIENDFLSRATTDEEVKFINWVFEGYKKPYINIPTEEYVIPKEVNEFLNTHLNSTYDPAHLRAVKRSVNYAKRNFTYMVHAASVRYHLTNLFGDVDTALSYVDKYPEMFKALPIASRLILRQLKDTTHLSQSLIKSVEKWTHPDRTLDAIEVKIRLAKRAGDTRSLGVLERAKKDIIKSKTETNRVLEDVLYNEFNRNNIVDTMFIREAPKYNVSDFVAASTDKSTNLEDFLKATPQERMVAIGMKQNNPVKWFTNRLASGRDDFMMLGTARENFARMALAAGARLSGASEGEYLKLIEDVFINYARKTPAMRTNTSTIQPFGSFSYGAMRNSANALSGRRGLGILLKTLIFSHLGFLGLRYWSESRHNDIMESLYKEGKFWITDNNPFITNWMTSDGGRFILTFPMPSSEIEDFFGVGNVMHSFIKTHPTETGTEMDYLETLKNTPNALLHIPGNVITSMFNKIYKMSISPPIRIFYGMATGKDIINQIPISNYGEPTAPWYMGDEGPESFDPDNFKELIKKMAENPGNIRAGSMLKYLKFIVKSMERNVSTLDQMSYVPEETQVYKWLLPGVFVYYPKGKEKTLSSIGVLKYWRDFWSTYRGAQTKKKTYSVVD